MERTKVDYGIDLGTTNSAICRMEVGVPTIKKMSDQADTLPSCVQIKSEGRKVVGSRAYRTIAEAAIQKLCNGGVSKKGDIFIEFKRNMGSDHTFHCEVENLDYTPEELSAEVLKTLKSVCNDDTVDAAVITIPAMFTEPQRNATMQAAKLAGLQQCSLLQEPIAAAMAYGLKQGGEDGIWMVFDFGGGTFDSALIRSSEGVIEVFDTEGNNYLGGKNIDNAFVQKILIPRIQEEYTIDDILEDEESAGYLREALKAVAESCKKQLSFSDSVLLEDLCDDTFGEDDDGEDIELHGMISRADFRSVCEPIYQEAVDCCVRLMKRQNLSASQIDKLILVGGPTMSPIVREMLRDQVTPNVDTSIDPMTAVATGAALFASTLERKQMREVSADTVRLDVQYEATSVQEQEYVTVGLAEGQSGTGYQVEILSGDGVWSSGQIALTQQGDVVEVPLKPGKANAFRINVTDSFGSKVECFPGEITILQGVLVKAPPLAYSIGIETWDANRKKGVFTALKGLERNQPLPAVGMISGLSTTTKLSPGSPSDVLRIPIYEGEDGAVGKLARLSHLVQEIQVFGTDVPDLVDEKQDVDLTVRVNESGLWHLELYFPCIDWTFEKDFELRKTSEEDASETVDELLGVADKEVRSLDGVMDTSAMKKKLASVRMDWENGSQPDKSLTDVKHVLRELEDCSEDNRWAVCEKDYNNILKKLDLIEKIPEDSRQEIDTLKAEFEDLKAEKDAQAAESVVEDLRSLYYHLNSRNILISILLHYQQTFDSFHWNNPARAKSVLQRAMEQIYQGAPTEALRQSFITLYEMLPMSDQAEESNGLLAGGLQIR